MLYSVEINVHKLHVPALSETSLFCEVCSKSTRFRKSEWKINTKHVQVCRHTYRGPAENGRKPKGWRLSLLALLNLSGRNSWNQRLNVIPMNDELFTRLSLSPTNTHQQTFKHM